MKKKIVLFMLGLFMMLAGKTNVFATYTYYSCNAGTGGHGWANTLDEIYKEYGQIKDCNTARSTFNPTTYWCYYSGEYTRKELNSETGNKEDVKYKYQIDQFGVFKYAKKPAYACKTETASNCSGLPWEVCTESSNNECKVKDKKCVDIIKAPVSGCYYCGAGTKDYYYYSSGTALSAYCDSTTPNSSYVQDPTSISGKCKKGNGTKTSTTTTTKKVTTTTTTTTSTTTKKTSSPKTKDVPTNTEVTSSEKAGYYYIKSGAKFNTTTGYNVANCGDKVKISECTTSNICTVTEHNSNVVSGTINIDYKYLVNSFSNASCGPIFRYINKETSFYSDINLTKKTSTIPCKARVELKKSPGDACNTKSCEVSYNGNIVYVDRNYLRLDDKAVCTVNQACESSKKITDGNSTYDVKICAKKNSSGYYEEVSTKIDDAVSCTNDYTKTLILKESTCDGKNDSCYYLYSVSCEYVKNPAITGTGGNVQGNGYGPISFSAKDNGNYGIKGYFISSGEVPTKSSNWISFSNNNYAETLSKEAGTYFVWVINNKDKISLPIAISVYDADASTTAAELSIKDPNTNQIYSSSSIETISYNINGKYALLSNSLKDDSVIADGYDKFKTSYELTVSANKVAIYATLTSKDASFIDGYEPRTINLEYGRNVALIKIKNNKGKVRTYTFIINREDNRTNDNLIKNVTLSSGTINFDSYVSDYTINVGKNTKYVNINATLASTTSSFVKGYEPRKIELNNETTSTVIKVVSEAGIVRSYVFTFVRGNEEDKDINKSVLLNSLSIPGTEFEFDKNTTGYNVSVEYEVDSLPVYAFAESNNASVKIEGNLKLNVGPNSIQITVTNGSKSKVYTVHVTRKEAGLGVTNDTTLRSLNVGGYDLAFDPSTYDYILKIKREKTLQIVAEPNSNRSDVYMYGNNDLTGFSSVRIKVIAENGETGLYSIDIQKDAYNKKLEIAAAIVGGIVIISAAVAIVIKKKVNSKKEYESAE